MSERPILIVDGMNMFIRAWAAYPTMSAHGYQMGGTIGFIKSLSKLVFQLSPSQVIVAWEGGGSTKRRGIYKDYKAQRKPEKLNRFYGDDIPESNENRSHQIRVLLSLLKFLPVYQVYASDAEADDMIAYLCLTRFKDENKIIASSDKDMYQLLNDKTRIYSLHKKIFVEKDDVYKEYKILASNFALAKSICGDNSDNIPGVPRIGFKTLSKKVPILMSQEDLNIDDVIAYCEANHNNKVAPLMKISESKELIKRNWRLIYLSDHPLSLEQEKKVDYYLDNHSLNKNRIGFEKILIREGVDFDAEKLFNAFVL